MRAISENHSGPNRPSNNFGFDGVSDRVDVSATRSSPPKSPVNLYKALPEAPGASPARAPLSGRTDTSSFVHSQDTTNRPSTASSVYSGLSHTSSKTKFKVMTRSLVDPEAERAPASPVYQPDMHLHPSKYDPGNLPKSPRTPSSFTAIKDSIPPMTGPRSPMYMPPPLSLNRNKDPAKANEGRGLPQSHSEPTLQGFDEQQETRAAQYHVPAYLSLGSTSRSKVRDADDAGNGTRGRSVQRPDAPARALQDLNEDEVLEVKKTSRKRSRSPVKRMLGLGKSASLKDMASGSQTQSIELTLNKGKKAGLKGWSDKLKHGFLSSDPKLPIRAAESDVETTQASSLSSFPVSLLPPYQAKVYSEIELMICVTANAYLIREKQAGRMSTESIKKVKTYWTSKNRPQVVEFQYDQMTQRDLVLDNLTSFKFHGEAAENPLVLNATMYSWKTMAKEMSIRTFCAPDSVIRKHMHDAHKLLEMLGAPLVTFLAFQELQLRTLAKINEKIKAREERRVERGRLVDAVHTATGSSGTMQTHSRKSSKDEGQSMHGRTSSKEEKIPVEDGFEHSRGGRLGLMIRKEGS